MFEIECDAPPGVLIDGFKFLRNAKGVLRARCCFCHTKFVVGDDVEAARHAMRVHLDVLHGKVDRLRPVW